MGNKTISYRNAKKKVKAVYPNLFKNAGPSCLNGPCPEGAMTCGNIIKVREKFSNL